MFFQTNGWFMAKTIGRQLRGQGIRWVLGFPGYYRESKKDGMDLKLVVSQYVYFHGDSFFEERAGRRRWFRKARPAPVPAARPVATTPPKPAKPEPALVVASTPVTLLATKPAEARESTVDLTLY